MDYWIIGVTALAIIYTIYHLFSRGEEYFDKHGIPYMKSVPILGNFAPILCGREALPYVIQKVYNLNSDAKYVGFYDFTRPAILVRDPELAKLITVKHFEHFMDHRGFTESEHDYLFSKNLISLRGDRWKDIRNLLTPAFTSSKMKAMFELMSKCAGDLAQFLADLPEEKKVMEMKNVFTRYANDVIATCAFGITVDSLKNPDNEFYVNGRKATNFNTAVQTTKFLLFRSFPNIARVLNWKLIPSSVCQYFEDVIRTTIRTRDEKGIRRPDMIQLMMDTRGKREPGKELTIEDMTSQAFIFFFGGFDTVSTAMTFASYTIALNPSVEATLQKEIDRVLEENNGQFSYDAVNKMEYLDAVVNEVLRLYPIGSFLDRVVVKDYELPPTLPGSKPVALKPGAAVWISVFPYHYDPKYFEEPEKFKPERFLKDGKKILNSGVYIPFGTGPRMCIAQRFALLEVKILLCHLLARCNLKPCDKTHIPIEISKSSFDMVPEGGCWLKVEPRDHGYLATHSQ